MRNRTLRRLCGLPLPEPQFWVEIRGIPTYRLDFAYPHARIAIEYAFEDSSKADRDSDRARRKWLRDHGWLLIVLTKESYRSGTEVAWIAELCQALRDRARHLVA